LLYVLAQSIQRKKDPETWWQHWKNKAGILMGAATLIALATTAYFYGFYNRDFRRAMVCPALFCLRTNIQPAFESEERFVSDDHSRRVVLLRKL